MPLVDLWGQGGGVRGAGDVHFCSQSLVCRTACARCVSMLAKTVSLTTQLAT